MAAATGQSAIHSATDREAMLRRVAIVLNSLPAPVAAKLLGSIDPKSKQALRRTMTGLADVDPLEHRRAIEAFKVSVQSPPRPNAGSAPYHDAEFMSGGVGETGVNHTLASVLGGTSSASAPDPVSPLSFLNEVDDESLAGLLRDEHPQAIALVMASVEPAKAGRILPLLPDKLRSATLSRIGRLDDIPEEAAAEMESHFRTRIEEQGLKPQSQKGKKKLDAILASMPVAAETNPSHGIATAPETRVAPTVAPRRSQTFPGAEVQRTVSESELSDAAMSALELGKRLRQIQDESASNQPPADTHRSQRDDDRESPNVLPFPSAQQNNVAGHAVSAHPPEATPRSANDQVMADFAQHQANEGQADVAAVGDAFTAGTSEPSGLGASERQLLQSTDQINDYLVGLAPIDLCRAMGKCETKDAMLTLCGLPHDVAEAALMILPKDQARIVRKKMANLSLLNLREIDNAKERVARESLLHASSSTEVPLAA